MWNQQKSTIICTEGFLEPTSVIDHKSKVVDRKWLLIHLWFINNYIIYILPVDWPNEPNVCPDTAVAKSNPLIEEPVEPNIEPWSEENFVPL